MTNRKTGMPLKLAVKFPLRNYFVFTVCFALSTTLLPANSNRLSFLLPAQDKLVDGIGPDGTTPSQTDTSKVNLAPVGINDNATDGSSSYLKSSVSRSDYVSKNTNTDSSSSDKSISVIKKSGDISDKLIHDAKIVDVMPLALIESNEESEKKAETILSAEAQQLSDLWQSTINRNPDIQFVINKLQPTSDHSHAMANTMKFLSATLFGAMNMAPMVIPGAGYANPGTMLPMGAGSSLLQSLFIDHAQKQAKKYQISQEQATMLYKMVRDVADKLVTSYREYKRGISTTDRACQDLQELQSMVAEIRGTQDAAKQIEMEYTLRKAKRDIEEHGEIARAKRQEIVDLAGNEAIAKLDKDFQDEKLAVEKLTGMSTSYASNQQDADGPFVNPLNPLTTQAQNRQTASKNTNEIIQ